MIKQMLQGVVAMLIIGMGIIGCSSSDESKSATTRRYVKVERLGKAQSAEELIFHGQLKEKKEVSVAFKVGGQVYNMLVDEGDYVTKEQVIARIDPRDYKIRLQSAKAQFEQASGEYTRYKELYNKNKLPINTLEKLEAGYLAAKSAYESAENALADTELKAPFNGYIYRKQTNNFENVAPGQPIYALLDVSHLEVLFSLPESKVNKAKSFSQITIDVANAGAYNVPANVLSVNEKANGNDMFDVRLMVNNQLDNGLKPGMSAKVRIQLKAADRAGVVVPVESVFYKEQKAYVWVFDEASSTVSSRAVKVNKLENNGHLSVSSGLTGNEYVVTAGVYSLTESQAVRILENTNLL
ncbi:efflux RND transporter periplasmic adaptor subunit [Carboxylicivirga sediminis]|uniref:Efflux RND transporter periplasmic adaptor subunit n=1 Tax=Carboxylicivirga sediminis TaxID=2006564 RepID=A0A941F334_9BACT|nr:efflux RND transporter periplasmic adaptor subunit [Carboxylicivirga sediminis]MBR8535507.1 efflux RND transporter periplasmic adaptor subunit [Carboxylicivirga sediminis]